MPLLSQLRLPGVGGGAVVLGAFCRSFINNLFDEKKFQFWTRQSSVFLITRCLLLCDSAAT